MIIPKQLPVFPMSQLHHLITMVTNRIMKISGCPINRIQFIIIREIYSKNGLSQTALARLIGMDRNNLSRVCTDLETQGIIRRKVREVDRRHNILELTEYGRAVYLRGDQAMEHYRQLTRRKYSPEEWNTFKETLQGFFMNLVDIMEMPDDALIPDPTLRAPLETDAFPAPKRAAPCADKATSKKRREHPLPKE